MSAPIAEVGAWLAGRHPDLGTLDPELDLIEHRLIDSLGFLEFLGLIERLTGRPVDVEATGIDCFRSLSSIERTFFARA
jgi:acyl carrier protein